ncbi:MAG: iron ABC transporter substrate-binding protein [Brachymonas sp.]
MKKSLWKTAMAVVALSTASWNVRAQIVRVTDMAKRSVTVPATVNRIVALGPGALRLITYLQATDRIVGVEDLEKNSSANTRPYILAHSELTRLPSVGRGGPAETNKKPDLEALLSVRPQVIFATYMDARLANEVQQTIGVPVVLLDYGAGTIDLHAVNESLRLAGRILQREQRAEAVIAFIHQAQQDLQKRTANIAALQRASAYVGGIGQRGAHGIESTEQNYPPFDWVGVNNLAKQFRADSGTYLRLDKERLLKLNPPIIFVDSGGRDIISADYAKNPPFYRALQAFQKGQVYHLHPFNGYTTNIDTMVVDAYAVAKVLYPKQFTDVNVPQKADSVYQFMVGKPVYDQMRNNYGSLGEKIIFQ